MSQVNNVQKIVEYIRAHIQINELNDKETLDYDYVVKEYYPKVMYWLDERDLKPTEKNISSNSKEISEFVNKYTLNELHDMENEKIGSNNESKKPSNAPEKVDKVKTALVLGVIIVILYLIISSKD